MILVDLHKFVMWLYLSDGSKILGVRGYDGRWYRAMMDPDNGDVYSAELEPGSVVRFCNRVHPPVLGDQWELVRNVRRNLE